MNKAVFTCGDINGVGPEIVIKTFNRIYSGSGDKLIFLCPAVAFENTAKKTLFKYRITEKYNSNSDTEVVDIIDLGECGQDIGEPTKISGQISYNAVELSCSLALKKEADCIITAPISKYALSLAGIEFPGHTEMYAKWTDTANFIMTFISDEFKAALLTIHEPLKDVPGLITESRLIHSVDVIINCLRNDFGIDKPRIAVLGLNPHAGENGRIGLEEKVIIIPAIEKSIYRDSLFGPFVPDAFFANRSYKDYDMVLGMYHDQLLIPFKMLNFMSGVNYTAGLPIIRTSPDHGTAFDIAGKNIADEASILEAFNLAKKISANRRIYGLN
jgi:4-hydroxythreonine-4-phosphate dehydrogenase